MNAKVGIYNEMFKKAANERNNTCAGIIFPLLLARTFKRKIPPKV